MVYPPNIVNTAESLPSASPAAPSPIAATEVEYYLSVQGTIYGPYNYALMQQYVGESRVGPQSLVSNHANAGFKAAKLWPEFSAWVAAQNPQPVSDTPPLPSVFIVIVDIESNEYMDFVRVLQPLGKAYRLSRNVWILSAPATADQVRDTLSSVLSAEDRLFIHDSFSNRAGWFNIGENLDTNIRELWIETAKTRRHLKGQTQ